METEAAVGPFKADLLARAVGEEDHFVVVENQFGKTNHDHLSKLLTYASGLKAKTVIWIAEDFTDEHREALDWLNQSSSDGPMMFGLEVEALCIGDSPPAPHFRVVSSPNIWAQAVRESRGVEPSATKLDQQKFWEEVRDEIRSHKPDLPARQTRPQHWYEITIGRSGFNISLTLNSRLERIGCELYIQIPQAKQAFDLLLADKDQIEKQIGSQLDWQRLEGREACRIALYKEESIYNAVQRDEIRTWMIDQAVLFHKVFGPRVKVLKLSQEE